MHGKVIYHSLFKAHFTQTLAVSRADVSLVFHTRGPWEKALGDIILCFILSPHCHVFA